MPEIRQIQNLFRQAKALDQGPQKAEILEEAVKIADAINDEYWQYQARLRWIRAENFGGSNLKALTAFTWCVSCFDRSPEKYQPRKLLWRYKWILPDLCLYTRFTKGQVTKLQDDFERRLIEFGYELSPLYKLKYWSATSFHEPSEVQLRWFNLWQESRKITPSKMNKRPDNSIRDCEACEVASLFPAHVRFDQLDEAMQVVQPILDGELSCVNVPWGVYDDLLEPLVKLNRKDEAELYNRKGYSYVSRRPWHVGRAADYMHYSVEKGDLARASRILQKHLPYIDDHTSDSTRYFVFLRAWVFLRRLAAASSRDRKLRIPRSWDCYKVGDMYNVDELADWFEQETRSMATAFDQRNGNGGQSRQMQQFVESFAYACKKFTTVAKGDCSRAHFARAG